MLGVRWRADVLCRPAKVAVFVDGCFWHGCREHGRRTRGSKARYWADKLRRNQGRNGDTDSRLGRPAGWLPVRLSEHQDLAEAARNVAKTVRGHRCKPQ